MDQTIKAAADCLVKHNYFALAKLLRSLKNVYLLKINHETCDSEVGYYEYVSNVGYVVLAENESEARLLASKNDPELKYWLDEKYTTCELVDLSGPSSIVMADRPTG